MGGRSLGLALFGAGRVSDAVTVVGTGEAPFWADPAAIPQGGKADLPSAARRMRDIGCLWPRQ